MKFIVLPSRSIIRDFQWFFNSSIDFPHNVFFSYIQEISYVLDTNRIMRGFKEEYKLHDLEQYLKDALK